ncbi:serine hydrolase-domain-containing protein [Aspergillus aurantiobrunneus]
MPKILCLHGHGTSASIFKSQTASFRSKLPPSYTFDFISAPFPSAPAPGIKAIYPDSPTYTWFREATPSALRDAHRWVAEHARDHGPYEAVMGFSQGCSLIATMALYHSFDRQRTDNAQQYEELPFRAAIFICGGVPLYALQDMGLGAGVSDRAETINRTTGALLSGTAGKLASLAADTTQIKRGEGLWDGNVAAGSLIHDAANRPRRDDVFGLDFTAFPAWASIAIPTVHVYGCKDPRWPAGIQLAEFCSDRVEFDHGGGHDIPRTSDVSGRIAELLREEVKNEVQQGDKGGKPGQWSARKAQMTAAEYKARGGDYTTSKEEKKPEQKNLDNWTGEEWQTKEGSGTAKQDDGTRKRYLPKKAWEELDEGEKEATEEKKAKGSKKGTQYVGNTGAAKRKRQEVSKGKHREDKQEAKEEEREEEIEDEDEAGGEELEDEGEVLEGEGEGEYQEEKEDDEAGGEEDEEQDVKDGADNEQLEETPAGVQPEKKRQKKD